MNEADEAYLEREMAQLSPVMVLVRRDAYAAGICIACACVGPPPGCTLCFCHMKVHAETRVMGEPDEDCAHCRTIAEFQANQAEPPKEPTPEKKQERWLP